MIGLAVATAVYLVTVSLSAETGEVYLCPVTQLVLEYNPATGVLHIESRLAWTQGNYTELVTVYLYNCTSGDYTVYRVYTPVNLHVGYLDLSEVLIVALSPASASWITRCTLAEPVYFSLCGVYMDYDSAKRCEPVVNCSGSVCTFVNSPSLSHSCPSWNVSANIFLWLGRLVRVALVR